MRTETLNEDEMALLFTQEPSTRTDGGFQSLMVALQEATNRETREIELSDSLLERIQRYAFQYGNGGWESRLLGIFERTLGLRLDGNV
jgi:hypothetical protein